VIGFVQHVLIVSRYLNVHYVGLIMVHWFIPMIISMVTFTHSIVIVKADHLSLYLCVGNREWAHIGCAWWLYHTNTDTISAEPFPILSHRQPVTQSFIEQAKAAQDRRAVKCSICDTTEGATLICSAPECVQAFHGNKSMNNITHFFAHSSTMFYDVVQ
jgi:hypothetical protein